MGNNNRLLLGKTIGWNGARKRSKLNITKIIYISQYNSVVHDKNITRYVFSIIKRFVTSTWNATFGSWTYLDYKISIAFSEQFLNHNCLLVDINVNFLSYLIYLSYLLLAHAVKIGMKKLDENSYDIVCLYFYWSVYPTRWVYDQNEKTNKNTQTIRFYYRRQ